LTNGAVQVFNILPNQIKLIGTIVYHKEETKIDVCTVADIGFYQKGSEGILAIIEEQGIVSLWSLDIPNF
jgi:hypothetical protein